MKAKTADEYDVVIKGTIMKPGVTYAIWTLAPLFRPAQAVRYARFAKWEKKNIFTMNLRMKETAIRCKGKKPEK